MANELSGQTDYDLSGGGCAPSKRDAGASSMSEAVTAMLYLHTSERPYSNSRKRYTTLSDVSH